MAKDLKRFNIYMSHGIFDFYSKMAEDMGITVSAAMVIALKTYMDAQRGLEMSGQLKEMLQQLQGLEIPNDSHKLQG